MRKSLIILYLFISLSSFAQSNFSNGFSDGYKKGYCQNQGIGCLSPLPPIAPIPNVNENINSYQDGYNRGFTTGLNSQKSSNSNSDRQRYQTTEAEFVQDKMNKINLNDAIAVAALLRNFKDDIVNLGDRNPERQTQLCKAGLNINPKDIEFLMLLGRIYARHYNDDKTALFYLEKAYRYDINRETGVLNLINAIKNGTVERINSSNEVEIKKSQNDDNKAEDAKKQAAIGSLTAQAQELKWHTDVKEAISIGNKEKKPLLLFFTGSDWCGWCIRLQKEVLKTPEFAAWAKENVVLVELDYPRRTSQTPELKKQNAELQQAFEIQGFPTIYFAKGTTNKEGKVNFEGLGKTGYVAGGPTAWLAVADQFIKANKEAEAKNAASSKKKNKTSKA